MLKAGFIQPETIPGHFPKNLRTIVELYLSLIHISEPTRPY